MAVARAIAVPLDRLTAQMQRPQDPANGVEPVQFQLNTAQGPWTLSFEEDRGDAAWVELDVFWGGGSNTEPQDTMYDSIAISACKCTQRVPLFDEIGGGIGLTPAQVRSGVQLHSLKICKWSELQQPVLDGYTLHATVFLAGSSGVGPADLLAVCPSCSSDFGDVRRTPAIAPCARGTAASAATRPCWQLPALCS